MNKVLNSLKNNKYITLLIACMLTFAYMGGTRKYIYDNCSKVFSFARFGSSWFNLSIGISVLMAVAICVGVAVMFLLRKKITMNVVVFGYGISCIISIFVLIFTPYNLQLLSPTTQLDTFATITMLAAMVFGLTTTAVLSASLSAHIVLALDDEKLIAAIIVVSTIVLSTILASLAVAFNWSLQIYFGVLTLLLFIFHIINSVTKSERENNICVKEVTVIWVNFAIVIAIAVIAIIAVLVSSGIVVENSIKF